MEQERGRLGNRRKLRICPCDPAQEHFRIFGVRCHQDLIFLGKASVKGTTRTRASSRCGVGQGRGSGRRGQGKDEAPGLRGPPTSRLPGVEPRGLGSPPRLPPLPAGAPPRLRPAPGTLVGTGLRQQDRALWRPVRAPAAGAGSGSRGSLQGGSGTVTEWAGRDARGPGSDGPAERSGCHRGKGRHWGRERQTGPAKRQKDRNTKFLED